MSDHSDASPAAPPHWQSPAGRGHPVSLPNPGRGLSDLQKLCSQGPSFLKGNVCAEKLAADKPFGCVTSEGNHAVRVPTSQRALPSLWGAAVTRGTRHLTSQEAGVTAGHRLPVSRDGACNQVARLPSCEGVTHGVIRRGCSSPRHWTSFHSEQ